MYDNSLFGGLAQLPGVLEDPVLPRPQVVGGRGAPLPAMQQAGPRLSDPNMRVPVQGPGAGEQFQNALAQLFTGAGNPRLMPEQEDQARKQALMMAGLQMMANSGPSAVPKGLMQILAQGAMTGQQAGGAAREQAYMATQEERIQQALQDPELTGHLTPRQRALIRMMPPMDAVRALQEMAFAPGEGPKVVGEGAALVGADGKPLFTNTRAADPWKDWPSEMRAAALGMGITDPTQITPDLLPRIFEKASEYRRSGATNVSVNNNPERQTAQGVTDIAIDDYRSLVESARTAQGRLSNLAVMQGLVDDGMTSGRMEALTEPLRGYAASLGIANADQLGQQQLFRGLSNRLALQARGQGEMPGQMSDRDIKLLLELVPRLENTPEGNRLLIDILSRQSQREIALANLANRYIAENGTLDHRWLQFKNDWIANNPLLGDLDPFSDIGGR